MRGKTITICLSLAFALTAFISAVQNRTIEAQRSLIHTMEQNPACMVAPVPTKRALSPVPNPLEPREQ